MSYYRHRFVFFLLSPFFRLFLKIRYNFAAERYNGKKTANFILSNHVCTMDPFMVSMSFRAPIYFVTSEHILRLGFISKVIKFLVDPIGKLKSTSDLVTVKQMLHKLKQNKNVCLFPEGNRTFNGVTAYIAPAIGKLIKASGVDVLFYVIEEGYLADPRWGETVRKGQLTGRVKSVLRPEEYRKMSSDEIVTLVRNELFVQPTPIECKNSILFQGKCLAEYLERTVFLCPKCNKIATIQTKGDKGICTNCELVFEYLATGYLYGAELPFQTIYEWDMWQREYITSHRFYEGTLICEDRYEYMYLISRSKKNQLIGIGTLKLFTNKLQFINMHTEEIYEYDFDMIENMIVHGRQVLQVSYSNKDFYEFKNKSVRSAVKYMYYFYFYKQTSKGDFNGFFGI